MYRTGEVAHMDLYYTFRLCCALKSMFQSEIDHQFFDDHVISKRKYEELFKHLYARVHIKRFMNVNVVYVYKCVITNFMKNIILCCW